MVHHDVPIDVFVGVDVGKTSHHAVALSVAGSVLLDEAFPQDEARLRAVIDRLVLHGRVLLVVDQPATIGEPSRVLCRPHTGRSSGWEAVI